MTLQDKMYKDEKALLSLFYQELDSNKKGNIPMRLILNYTMACPLSCDFCCYGCHPNRKEKMPYNLAKKLILEASEIDSIDSVSFTGGEPMLFIDEIYSLAELLNDVELPFSITTAGHWGKDPEEARGILLKLKSNGLFGLNISCDPSHSEFVSKEFITNIAKISSDLGIVTTIVGTFYSLEDNLETYLPNLIGYKYIVFSNHYVSKVGRASNKAISQEKYKLNYSLEDFICPRNVDNDLVVFFDGKAYPCCSAFNRNTPGIILGNANNESLTSLINTAQGLFKFQVMKRNSFSYIYKMIEESDTDLFNSLPKVDGHTSACSLCNKIYKDKALTSKLEIFFAKKDAQLVNHLLSY